MGKHLTIAEKITRFSYSITKRKAEKAYKGKSYQCWYCMETTENKMLGDIYNDTEHLLLHMKEQYVTWGVLKHAYQEMGMSEQELCHDIANNDLYYVWRAVEYFLSKRLIPEYRVSYQKIQSSNLEELRNILRELDDVETKISDDYDYAGMYVLVNAFLIWKAGTPIDFIEHDILDLCTKKEEQEIQQ